MDIKDLFSACVAAIVFYLILKIRNRNHDQLRQKGKAGIATVISVTQSSLKMTTGSTEAWDFDFVLAVHQPDASTTNLNVTQNFIFGEQPNAGDKVDIWIDPTKPNNVVIQNNGYVPNKKVTIFGMDIPYRQTTYKSRY